MDAKSKSESEPQPSRAAVDNRGMDEAVKQEWDALAERLLAACPEKFEEVLAAMRDLVDAQEIIAGFDWQLMHRGRPRKKYTA